MDCMVEAGQVKPLRYRILCKIAEVEKLIADGLPWADDGVAIWAFNDEQRDEIMRVLDGARIAYNIVAEDQPDAQLLASVQERATTRTEARAYLGQYWIICEQQEAATAHLEYNRTANGVVAYSDPERDAIVQQLTASGGTPQVTVAKRPAPTAEELDQRLKELEDREIAAEGTPSEG